MKSLPLALGLICTFGFLSPSKANSIAHPLMIQTNDVPVPAALKKFVPKGYQVLNITKGDLNLDAYPDVIMVLKKISEEETTNDVDHPEKRPLLILTGQPDKSYRLAARSENTVYCFKCGGIMGDPFSDITIKKGYFTVEHFGGSAWRWTRFVTYKYSSADKNWYLHKDGHESYHATEPEKGKTTTYTIKDFGKVPFTQFDIYKEK